MDIPLLAIIYELPARLAKNNGWKDPKTWGMVNPNLNRSVDETFLRDELIKAEAKGPKEMALLASQHFNVQVGVSLGGWRGQEFWEKCTTPELVSLEELLRQVWGSYHRH